MSFRDEVTKRVTDIKRIAVHGENPHRVRAIIIQHCDELLKFIDEQPKAGRPKKEAA